MKIITFYSIKKCNDGLSGGVIAVIVVAIVVVIATVGVVIGLAKSGALAGKKDPISHSTIVQFKSKEIVG